VSARPAPPIFRRLPLPAGILPVDAVKTIPPPAVAAWLGLHRAREQYKYACVWCDSSDALDVRPGRPVKCFSCGKSGSVIDLAMAVRGLDFTEAVTALADQFGIGRPNRRGGTLACTYDYVDADGQLRFQVLRFTDPKRFVQRRPDPERPGAWLPNLDGITPLLYRLPEVLTAVQAGTPVVVVEGEKDADRLAAGGLVATTAPMGASARWRPEFTSMLSGGVVLLGPDHVEAGGPHAEKVAAALHGVARSVRVLTLPSLSEKGDVSDWLDAGYTVTDLRLLAQETACWTPPPVPLDPASARGRVVSVEMPVEPFLTDAGLRTLPPLAWDVDGILPTGGLDFLIGPPGVGKTLLGIDWACRLALGWPWHGQRTERQSVLYVAAEGPRSLHTRLDAWKFWHKLPVTEETGVIWWPHRLALADPVAVTTFIAKVQDAGYAPRRIIVDTLARCTQGGRENDPDSMGRALAGVDLLREKLDAGVLLLAHPPRDGGDTPRGHSSQDGAADAIWALREQDGARLLSCAKLKDGDASRAFPLTLVQLGVQCILVPPEAGAVQSERLTTGQRKVLTALRDTDTGGGVLAGVVKDALGAGNSSVHFILKALHDRGLADVRRSRWHITPVGLVQLSSARSSGVSSES
jgi:hypothetical protein